MGIADEGQPTLAALAGQALDEGRIPALAGRVDAESAAPITAGGDLATRVPAGEAPDARRRQRTVAEPLTRPGSQPPAYPAEARPHRGELVGQLRREPVAEAA